MQSKIFFLEFYNVYPGVEHRCTQKCRKDCKFIYYIYTHGELKDVNLKYTDLRIEINHNNLPDILIKYLPRTEFISLVCEFGGLIGMWLGLSVIAVCETLIDFISMIYNQRNRIWLKVKNIVRVHIFNYPPILIKQNVIVRPRFNVNIHVS